jgi:hypothetical protein
LYSSYGETYVGSKTKGLEMQLLQKDLLSSGWTKTAITRFLPAPIVARTYGHTVSHRREAQAVLTALHRDDCRTYFAGLQARRDKTLVPPRSIDVLDATREASRAAHRLRDAASAQYEAGNHGLAKSSSDRKRTLYALKERGILYLHGIGVLRYVGVSPQGMAVYEYGNGALSCLHSTLHPAGAERTLVTGHPEILLVPAKERELRLTDVEHTLMSLPSDESGYERSAAPRHPKQSITCFSCGGEGHIARNCTEADDWDDLSIDLPCPF